MSDLWDKLIVALDLDSEEKIKETVGKLCLQVTKFKIGPVAYIRFGPDVVDWIRQKGADIFLDFKLYDIPNTMAETAKALVDLSVWAFTVHLKAGQESLSYLKKETTKYARENSKRQPLIFGVTELTSQPASLDQILKLSQIGKEAGLDGIVCSVWEAKKIKKTTGLLAVTPGIRREPGFDDQKRAATIKDAAESGSDYFVVGRPIIKSVDPFFAAKSLIESV